MPNSTYSVVLGKVGKPFGIQGALKIALANQQSDTLRPGLKVRFAPVLQEGEVFLSVEWVKSDGRIKFAELSDRTRAENFRGALVYVRREDFPKLAKNEVYLADIIGFDARDLNNESIGTVTGFYDTGFQVVLEIKMLKGHVAEVPYVKKLVPQVDMAGRFIVIDAPIGLLDEK